MIITRMEISWLDLLQTPGIRLLSYVPLPDIPALLRVPGFRQYILDELQIYHDGFVRHPDLWLRALQMICEVGPKSKCRVSLDEYVQLAIISKYGRSYLQRYANPSKMAIRAAISHDGMALEFVRHPSDEIKLMAYRQNGFAIERYPKSPVEHQLVAVTQNGLVLQLFPRASPAVRMAAIRQNPNAIQFLLIPTLDEALAAAMQDGLVLRHFRVCIEEAVQLAALAQNPEASEFINNPTKATLELLRSLAGNGR